MKGNTPESAWARYSLIDRATITALDLMLMIDALRLEVSLDFVN